jgi:Flp pilus assembly protein TadD
VPEVSDLLAEARHAALEGDSFDAANLARRVLATHPSAIAALRIQGWAQLNLNDDNAFDSFQTCASLDPTDPLAQVGQAIWFEKKGMLAQALERFIRAWELDPSDQRIRKEVVRLGGEFPESALAEGLLLLQAGRYEDATSQLRVAAAGSTTDVAGPLSLATALWRLGGRQQAYNLATTVLTARPQCVKAILIVVAVESSSGRLLRTRELMARAEQVDPGFTVYGEWLAEVGLEAPRERPAGRLSGLLPRL